MKPEQIACQHVEDQFVTAGWKVVDRDEFCPSDHAVVIVRKCWSGTYELITFLCLKAKR